VTLCTSKEQSNREHKANLNEETIPCLLDRNPIGKYSRPNVDVEMVRLGHSKFETTVEHYARKGENAMHGSRTSDILTATAVLGIVAYHLGDMTGFLSGGMIKAFAGEGAKKIAAGKPKYNRKTHPAWERKGRIVGRVRDCPGCEVKALDAKSKKVVKSCSVKRGGNAYELQWLKPGKYILLVTAKGYEALDVHDLVVRAKADLHVNIEF